jgi:TPR repeat protein
VFNCNRLILVVFTGLLLSLNAPAQANAKLEVGIYAKNEGKYDVALMAFKPLVELGFGAAQFEVAEMYEFGLGVKKDPKAAAQLYLKAAEQGYATAQFKVSRLYHEGKVLPLDHKAAIMWLKKSAALGLAAAQFNLALAFYDGDKVNLDYKKAYYWYKEAAFQNYVLAQYNLALMYYEGVGVRQDHSMSYVWNAIAAHNGYKDAVKSLQIDKRNLLPKEIQLAQFKLEELWRKIESKRTDMAR